MHRTTTVESLADKQQPKLTSPHGLLRGSVTRPPACGTSPNQQATSTVTAWCLRAPCLLSFHDLTCWKAPSHHLTFKFCLHRQLGSPWSPVVSAFCESPVRFLPGMLCHDSWKPESQAPRSAHRYQPPCQAPGKWPVSTKLYQSCAHPR